MTPYPISASEVFVIAISNDTSDFGFIRVRMSMTIETVGFFSVLELGAWAKSAGLPSIETRISSNSIVTLLRRIGQIPSYPNCRDTSDHWGVPNCREQAWLLKNSLTRKWPKRLCVRKPYKRVSRFG
jgi:hypothetical protein